MSKKDKHEKFQQIATARLTRILDDLDNLGNCSNPVSYAYDNQELLPFFRAISDKLEEVRQRLIMHSPYASIPFRLRPPACVELAGHSIRISELASETEVMALLDEGVPSFTTLVPIRSRYEALFGDELCWNCPVFHDGYAGCILLPVQEGILYLPYSMVDSETYEQFDLQGMARLTVQRAEQLRNALLGAYTELIHLLSDVQAFGLVRG